MSFLTNGLLAHTTKRHPLYCLFLSVLNYTDFILMDRWGTLLYVTQNDIGSWRAFFVKTKLILIGFSLMKLNNIK
jgi:hypothetical protein